MSMDQLNKELPQLLAMGVKNQNSIIKRLAKLIEKIGTNTLQKWRSMSNASKNSLLHELVEYELDIVMEFMLSEYELDIDVKRNSDGLTPFQLALKNQCTSMQNILMKYGCSEKPTNQDPAWLSDADKEKSMNLVWMDLEMTSLDDPKIMECAVIITDKDLKELERKQWVVHFENAALTVLGEWHQKTFADHDKGGNDLFADVLRSRYTKEQVEQELLDMFKIYCVPKYCSLAGSSIHIDKEVLKKEMPKAHDFLHYRILDVTSCQSTLKRWLPWVESKIKKNIAKAIPPNVNHRAMDDIEWSLAYMREFRSFLTTDQATNNNPREAQNSRPRKRSASPSLSGRSSLAPKNNISAVPRNDASIILKNSASRVSKNNTSIVSRNGAPINQPQRLYSDEKRLIERIKEEQAWDVRSLELPTRARNTYDLNPHLREVFLNKQSVLPYQKPFTDESRIIPDYSSFAHDVVLDPSKISTTEYWGQRKLLVTEIEFLTRYGSDGEYWVIYAGAAPATHVNLLASLFPRLLFVLYDSKEFDTPTVNNIKIERLDFDENCIKLLEKSKKEILFICNVHSFTSHENLDNDIQSDMRNERRWHEALKPRASLLNFRFSQKIEKFKHLQGELIIEPWSSPRALECRLIAQRNAKSIEYITSDIDLGLSYFNSVTRVMYYEHNIKYTESEGLDHCYDCRAEIFILQRYLECFSKVTSEADLPKQVADMSKRISREIQSPIRTQMLGFTRTLACIQRRRPVSEQS